MSSDSRYRYSLTIETHDAAVLSCLCGLVEFAEGFPGTLPSMRSLQETWRESDGRVVLRFSDAARRSLFLGEATRLLAGKWMRLAMSDDDARRSEMRAAC